jgi:hypothetical protein
MDTAAGVPLRDLPSAKQRLEFNLDVVEGAEITADRLLASILEQELQIAFVEQTPGGLASQNVPVSRDASKSLSTLLSHWRPRIGITWTPRVAISLGG